MQHMKVGYLRDPIVLPAATINEAVSIEKLFVVQDTQLYALRMSVSMRKFWDAKDLPSYLLNLLQEAMGNKKKKSQ